MLPFTPHGVLRMLVLFLEKCKDCQIQNNQILQSYAKTLDSSSVFSRSRASPDGWYELFEPRDRGILGGYWGHVWGLGCGPDETEFVCLFVKERGQTGHANTQAIEGWGGRCWLSALGWWGKTVETLGLNPVCAATERLNRMTWAQIGGVLKK